MVWVMVMEGKRRKKGGKTGQGRAGRGQSWHKMSLKRMCVCTLLWCRENLPSKVK